MLFEDIELLIVLSEAKSLSQAADQLYMSRPGLSQKISNFEKRVGRKLFERTSTGITPTKAGELVTTFARNAANLERVLASSSPPSTSASIRRSMSECPSTTGWRCSPISSPPTCARYPMPACTSMPVTNPT
ncbi:MAG: LysR family transcriptional regulator [Coriobacteriales bacterium]